ncbi:hypothetical protein [Dactylosporangium sp. NPDC000521]|uniref:hypothetical protein n=1 Tax=Dactylosporangium sp. NPDC000521 TaxID=3363975 RepID=UPI0036BF9F5B
MRPSIVVVGSGSADRVYEPPLRDQPRMAAAGHDIGREIARAGCDLVVFSSDQDFLDRDVVAGFAAGIADGAPGRIVVRTRSLQPVGLGLDGAATERLDIESDTADEWEVSFYRSVYLADGLIVIGGGRSTRIAGLLAITHRTPLAAVGAFGGGASVVREYLDKNRNDATADDIVLMGRPWSAQHAARLVRSVLDQRRRRGEAVAAATVAAARSRRTRTYTALTAVLALLAAAATVLLADAAVSHAVLIGLLLAGPMLGAVGGAMLRDSTDEQPHALWSAARGLGAGLLAAMLYVASQLLTSPDLLTEAAARRLLWFVIPMGIAAGYTFDLVYARLRRGEAVLVPAPGPSQPPV